MFSLIFVSFLKLRVINLKLKVTPDSGIGTQNLSFRIKHPPSLRILKKKVIKYGRKIFFCPYFCLNIDADSFVISMTYL